MSKSELREKTHIEAMADGSINKLSIGQLNELVGFIMPMASRVYNKKGKEIGKPKESWEVTCVEKGGGYTADTQSEAIIIASLEEVKLLLIKLLRKNAER